MTIVSKELFDKVKSKANGKRLFEDDVVSLDLNELADKIHKVIRVYDEIGKEFWIHNIPRSILFAGEGSSRITFILRNGQCLKCAKSQKGIAQNKQEIKVFNNSQYDKYKIFPKLYASDTANYTYLIEDLFRETNSMDWLNDSGEPLQTLISCVKVIETANGKKVDQQNLKQYVEKTKQSGTWLSFARPVNVLPQLFNDIYTRGEESYRSIRGLSQYCVSGGRRKDDLILDDLDTPQNWGLSISGQFKVIDAGLSMSVYNDFYSYSRRRSGDLI